MVKMFKAALFDLDGVVLDTESQYSVFWANVFQRYYGDGVTLAKKIKGQTLKQIYDAYFAGDEERQRRITSDLDAFEQRMSFPYIKGFVPFVASLRASGVKTAIVTSSTREKMESVYQALPELPSYFDAILTAEDFPRSKPAPDCYQIAARRLEATPEACVVFEDSINGLRSGRDSGARVVALATTNPANRIAPLAEKVVDDFQSIPSPQWLAERLGF